MPIRFRCPHCTRRLGIARRKAGQEILCPQCHRPLTVPTGTVPALQVAHGSNGKRKAAEDRPLFERDDVDALLGLAAPAKRLEPVAEKTPVSGLDVLSLEDEGVRTVVLDRPTVTVLAAALVGAMGVAFAAGFLVAKSW